MKERYFETLPLEKNELELREVYKGNSEIWDSGISFEEFMMKVESGELRETELSHNHKKKTKNNRGKTIDTVDVISNENEISVMMHERYSYPVFHNHSYIEIFYVCSGSCRHFADNNVSELKKGDFVIMNPDTMHALSVTDDETIVLNILASENVFGRSFIDMLKGDYLLVGFFEQILKRENSYSYMMFPTGNDKWMQDTAGLLVKEIKNKEYAYESAIALYVKQMFLHLIRNYEMNAVVQHSKVQQQNEVIVPILGYLSVNYNRTSLKKTADFFGYSAEYLSKMIKKFTGRNFTSIITSLQMTNAMRLMEEGEQNVTEIAYAVGCFDTSHFNKKFKAQYGVTATEYMKGLQQ